MSDFTLNKFNSLLDQASSSIMCDSECQKLKMTQELESQYLAAQNNLLTSQSQLETKHKNYTIFKEGTSGYNDYLDKKYSANAVEIAKRFQTSFNSDSQDVNSKIQIYSALLINLENIVDLYMKYLNENLALKQELKYGTYDIVTNDRKTFYENQGIASLNFYYYILLVINIVTLVVFLACIFIFPSTMSFLSKIGILISLIILFFTSSYLLAATIYGVYFIYNMLPKNVHLSI